MNNDGGDKRKEEGEIEKKGEGGKRKGEEEKVNFLPLYINFLHGRL